MNITQGSSILIHFCKQYWECHVLGWDGTARIPLKIKRNFNTQQVFFSTFPESYVLAIIPKCCSKYKLVKCYVFYMRLTVKKNENIFSFSVKKAIKTHFVELFQQCHLHCSLYFEIIFNIISTELKKNLDEKNPCEYRLLLPWF